MSGVNALGGSVRLMGRLDGSVKKWLIAICVGRRLLLVGISSCWFMLAVHPFFVCVIVGGLHDNAMNGDCDLRRTELVTCWSLATVYAGCVFPYFA